MIKTCANFRVLVVFMCFLGTGFSQLHKEANIDIGNNSSVEDIKYNYTLERYIVAGDFEQIGESQRKNLAFLNDDLKIMEEEPISSMDGIIKAIETDQRYLVIGGTFSEINGEAHNGLAIFEITAEGKLKLLDVDPITSKYAVISDIQFTNDQIVILGKFQYSLNDMERKNILVLEKENLSVSNKLFQNVSIDSYHPETLKMYETSDMYVVTGDHVKKGNNIESSGVKFDKKGEYLGEIVVQDDENKLGRELIQVSDNLFSYSRKPSGSPEIVIADIQENKTYARSPRPDLAQSSCYGNQLPDTDQEVYGGEVFYIQDYSPSTTVIERYGVEVNLEKENTVDFTSRWCNPITNDQGGQSDSRKLIAAKNKLFYFDKRMKKVEDKEINNKGFVSFCLEPIRPGGFDNPAPDPCEKLPTRYVTHEVKNADGYAWSYSGSGARIKEANVEGAKYQSLDKDQEVVFHSRTANEVIIEFEHGFTDGDLKVRAFTVCNNVSEKLFARPISTPIINPVSKLEYEASANGATYNCENQSALLTSTTNIHNATVHWKLLAPISGWHDGESVTVYASEYDTTFYEYIAEFRYLSKTNDQCVRTDTVSIPYYKDVPELQLSSNYLEFDCNNTSLVLIGSSTKPFDELWWMINDTIQSNPVSIDTSQFLGGTFYFYGRDSLSRCVDSVPLLVESNFDAPAPPLLNGSNFSQISPIGEISCNEDSLMVVPSNSFGESSSFYWLDENNVPIDTTYLTFGNTRDTVYVVGSNGCTGEYSVFVTENTSLANITPLADTALNCSVDTLLLVHPSNDLLGPNGWLSNGGTDTLVVTQTGDYEYTFFNPLNGCSGTDLLTVSFSNDILIEFSKPDYACQGQSFTVSANAIGIDTPNFTWESGSTTNTETGVGGTNDYLVVDVNDGASCTGHDTVFLTVAPVIQNQIDQFQSCDNQLLFLNNTVTSGGIAPFQYSIDGVNYSNNNTFADLNEGDYTVYIQDASQCIYQFPVTLVAGASPPDLKFLAATNNKPDDLVALVDVTTFNGFDTTYWSLPANIVFEYQTDSIRFVSAIDTGYYNISLIGEIGTCTYTFTKQIYFGEIDSVSFHIDEAKGIQNLNLYPNPNSGVFDVDVDFGLDQHYAIYVANISGELVAHSLQGFGMDISEHFDISAYPPGTYILRIISDYDNAYFPFVKQ